MTSDDPSVAADILAQPKFGSGIGFRRTASLLRPLLDSSWGQHFTTIKVTGSNGKGSVTALTHSILRALDLGCGRFTSPHLLRFNERILLDDVEITDDALAKAYSWVKNEVSHVQTNFPTDLFGSFELATATCIRSFFDADLPTAVIEAGIGGRYDTTRLLPGSLIALTSLDLEHTELLGKSLELIGYDKIDLCPDGGCVVAPRFDDDLWSRLSAYCSLRAISLVEAQAFCKVISNASRMDVPRPAMCVSFKSERLSGEAMVPLVGPHQVNNIAVAISLVDLWTKAYHPEITARDVSGAVIKGLGSVAWPGRFERISINPSVFIDVGHSPDACRRVVETVRTCLADEPILLVIGVSSNKAVQEILDILLPLAEGVIATRAHHLGENVDRIGAIVTSTLHDKPCWKAYTIEDAVRLARDIAESQNMTVLVAGGLFLAIEFRTAWDGRDPKALHFL